MCELCERNKRQSVHLEKTTNTSRQYVSIDIELGGCIHHLNSFQLFPLRFEMLIIV